MAVKLVTDSTADIPPELLTPLGISVVPLTVHFGEQAYRDGVDIDSRAFFERLAATSGELPHTAQPPPAAFTEAYQRLLDGGHEIVSVQVSAALSGTFNSAVLARDESGAPARITVVDSRWVSMCLGMAVLAGAELAVKGGGRTEVLAEVERVLNRMDLLLFVDTLEYLQRGGRIGAARAFLGGLLSVKPLITLRNGEVQPAGQVRTRSRAIDRLRTWVREEHATPEGFCVLHTACPEDAQGLFDEMCASYPKAKPYLAEVGAVVGTHVGPGGIGVAIY